MLGVMHALVYMLITLRWLIVGVVESFALHALYLHHESLDSTLVAK